MSRHYNNRDTFPYAFVMFFFVLMVFPIVPLTLLAVIILLLFKIKGIYTLITSITAIIVGWIFHHTLLTDLLNQIMEVLKNNTSCIIQGHFPEMKNFLTYSIFSYFVMSMMALALASLYKMRKERTVLYEEAGLKPLKKEIKEIKQEQNINIPKSKDGVLIGVNDSHKKVICPYNAKHFIVAGTTGSGKTVALANFIQSGMGKKFPLLLVDGKGDIDNDSMLEIVKRFSKQYNRNLITIDMNNPNDCSRYNPFQNVNATIAADMLINMTDWSEEHYKSNTKRYLQRLCQLLIQAGETLSFQNIISHMGEVDFFLLSDGLVKENIISKSEHTENEKIYESAGKIAQSSFARFATLAESELGKIFTGEGINITTALKNGDVILFILNPLLYPDTSSLLGRLILIDSKQAVSNLFDSEIRKFFVFDEVNVYASTVLLDLVNKSRSANVTCLLGTQSLADLEAVSPHFKQQTIENCNNYIVLRQNASQGASEWSETVGTYETMKMTYQIASDEEEETQKGSARRVREFIIHPDNIKSLKTGEGFYISRDYGVVEKLKINKPF